MVALVVTGLSLIPVGFIVWIAIDSGWDTVQQLVFRPRVGELLVITLLLEVVTLPIAIVLSVGLAFLVERTSLRFSRTWSWLLVAPLAVPAFVQSYAWNTVAPEFSGFSGAVLVSLLAYFPFLYLPVAAQLRRLDPTLEETAASLGLRPAAIFLRVVLPQLRLAQTAGRFPRFRSRRRTGRSRTACNRAQETGQGPHKGQRRWQCRYGPAGA